MEFKQNHFLFEKYAGNASSYILAESTQTAILQTDGLDLKKIKRTYIPIISGKKLSKGNVYTVTLRYFSGGKVFSTKVLVLADTKDVLIGFVNFIETKRHNNDYGNQTYTVKKIKLKRKNVPVLEEIKNQIK